MHPVLFRIGPVTLYTFGMMVAIAFLTASYLFSKELERRHLDPRIAGQITIYSLIGGLAGSRLFSIFENWSDFIRDPIGQLFSAAGLTFYGGFIVVVIWLFFYIKRKNLRFLLVADMVSPLLLLAYGIGRIGCQLAGDGDYGIPSSLPWAMTYPQGTAKPSYTLHEFFVQHPIERVQMHYDSLRNIRVGTDVLGQPITRFDEIVRVHPAPVYETIFCVVAFLLIWRLRERYEKQVGKMFSLVLVVMGVERFFIEFIRINPLYAGLSMAQWISIAMVALGGWALTFYYPSTTRRAVS